MRERVFSRDGYRPGRLGRSAFLECQVRGLQFRRNMTIAQSSTSRLENLLDEPWRKRVALI